MDDPMNTRDYTITVDFRHRPQCILQGSYDKKALPEDWGDFADALWWLLQSHGRGELLDPTVYGRIKRRTSDLMYCGVEFEGGAASDTTTSLTMRRLRWAIMSWFR